MKKNKKTIVLLSSILAISVLAFTVYSVAFSKNSNKVNLGSQLRVHNSEIILQEKDLVKASDLIVKAKILGIKERGSKISTAVSNGQEVNITLSLITYNIEVTESIKNKGNKKNLELLEADAKKDINIEVGEEYVLFLIKNKDGQYNIINYTQGFYEFDKSAKDKGIDKIKSPVTGEDYEYKKFKEKIQKLDN